MTENRIEYSVSDLFHFPCHGGEESVEQVHHLLVVGAALDELVLGQLPVSVDVDLPEQLLRPDLGVAGGALAHALEHVVDADEHLQYHMSAS